MQAENELLADQLAALPETEFWVMVNHRLHDCEAEAAAVYRGGACPDFTVDINEIRAGSAGKMQQRAEATEKLLKLHKHQLAIKTDRGTSGSSGTVHRLASSSPRAHSRKCSRTWKAGSCCGLVSGSG